MLDTVCPSWMSVKLLNNVIVKNVPVFKILKLVVGKIMTQNIFSPTPLPENMIKHLRKAEEELRYR